MFDFLGVLSAGENRAFFGKGAIMAKLACGLIAMATILGTAVADDEFVPPPKAEREAVAALVEIGAAVQIDAQYRVTVVMMPANCSNADLKLLAGCRELAQLSL